MKLNISVSISLLSLILVGVLWTASTHDVFAVTACEAIQANGGAVPNRKCIRKRDLSRDVVRNVNIDDNAVGSAEVINNSLFDVDIADEAGVDYQSGTAFIALTTTDTTIRSISLTAPSSGYVILTASGTFYGGETSSIDLDYARCSLGTNAAIDLSAVTYFIERTNTQEMGYVPMALTRVLGVGGASTLTYRLVCDEVDGDVSLGFTNLNGVFVPTRY